MPNMCASNKGPKLTEVQEERLQPSPVVDFLQGLGRNNPQTCSLETRV